MPASGAGYVTRFRIAKAFLDRYPVQEAGGREHLEYWIPAEDLPAFNAALVGEIEIIAGYPEPDASREKACMMTSSGLVELLTVVDRFDIRGRGVVVTPHLVPIADVPKAGPHAVVILASDGQRRAADAYLELTHFRISDPTIPAASRWALVLRFPSITKDDVPIGSRIMVPQSLRDELRQP